MSVMKVEIRAEVLKETMAIASFRLKLIYVSGSFSFSSDDLTTRTRRGHDELFLTFLITL